MTREKGKIRILQKGHPAQDSGRREDEEKALRNSQAARRERPTRHVNGRERMDAADCDIIITQSLYRKIVGHLSSDTSREQGGLLLGYEEQLPGRQRPTLVIDRALEARHTKGTLVRLTFTHETWVEFDRQTDELRERGINRRRVGWYHSHPGHGIFLSPYDMDVCEDFKRPTHVALVVDPLSNDGGFFVRGEAGFRNDSPQGFWEWHDLADESVVRWKSMVPSTSIEWDGALPREPPGSVIDEAGDGAEGSTGQSASLPAAASPAASAQAERPAVTSLFTSPVETPDNPSVSGYSGRRSKTTLLEVPVWAVALTACVLLAGVAALALVVYRMNKSLNEGRAETDAQKVKLDALSGQLDELKKGLAGSPIVEQTEPAEPETTPTPALNPAQVVPNDPLIVGTQPAREKSNDARNSNRRDAGNSGTRQAGQSGSQPPATVNPTVPPKQPADTTQTTAPAAKDEDKGGLFDPPATVKTPTPAPQQKTTPLQNPPPP